MTPGRCGAPASARAARFDAADLLVIVYAVSSARSRWPAARWPSTGEGPLVLTAVPAAIAALGMALAVAAAVWMPTEGTGRLRTAGAVLGGSVRGAIDIVRTADPRLLGAFAWWGFDMAVLYGMLNAFGPPPAVPVVGIAYFIGQVANTVPSRAPPAAGLVGVLPRRRPRPTSPSSPCSPTAPSRSDPPLIGVVALGHLRRTMARW